MKNMRSIKRYSYSHLYIYIKESNVTATRSRLLIFELTRECYNKVIFNKIIFLIRISSTFVSNTLLCSKYKAG